MITVIFFCLCNWKEVLQSFDRQAQISSSSSTFCRSELRNWCASKQVYQTFLTEHAFKR